ncbi:origin recognition complex subunit 3 [Biomphalaria glabrata]|nr:origin recognition complex subunit 3-like [Biomphalaria glabrata]
MSTNTATSVSTGCFVSKGKYKRANEINYLPDEDDKFIKHRLKHYAKQWDELSVQIDVLRSDLNAQIFDDLVAFILSCHKDRHDIHRLPITEIPTAVLVTGVNTPDHGVMFSNMNYIIKAKVTPFVARLLPKDCLRISSLINSIYNQLTNTLINPEDIDLDDSFIDESIDVDNTVSLKKSVRRKRTVSMSTLSKWYSEKCRTYVDDQSPRKKAKTFASPRKKTLDLKSVDETEKQDSKPHIVIMIEDIENMNASVLQDFISLCSSYLSTLPVVLVLGIATAITAIHQILSSSTSSLMCMEKFHAPPASQYLTHLLDKLIMTPSIPFKLGPKVLNFLLDNFLYHDFSIVNFIQGFKLCMLEHFLRNPLSELCCPVEDADAIASKLTQAEIEHLRRHPSFMRYVEGTPGPVQAKTVSDCAAVKIRLAQEVKNLHSFHKVFFPTLSFLHCLCQNLPKFPLGKHLRELYSTCLSETIQESEGYKQAFFFLRLMCCDELCELLGSCLKTIESQTSEKTLLRLNEDVNKFRYRLKHLDDEIEESVPGEAEIKILPQRAKLHELKEKLQSMSSSRKRSPYERLREEILSYLDNHFKCSLVSPMSLSLHEVLYFNELAAVKEQIRPSPRCAIQTALTEPGKLLSCPCCQCGSDSILSSMPDLCIVYKLHLECGTLVNLYDWLQAFVMIISSNDGPENPKKSKSKGPTVEQRARFIRAVSELQFLGFIKGTQRKTDHVTRLTW